MSCTSPETSCEYQLATLNVQYAKHETVDDSSAQWLSPLLNLTSHELVSYSKWARDAQDTFVLSRVAEASFGEIFRLSAWPSSPPTSTERRGHELDSVIKMIPLCSPIRGIRAETQERVHSSPDIPEPSLPTDVASEIMVLKRLSDTSGFVRFRDFRLLRGRPPPGIFNHQDVVKTKTQRAARSESSAVSTAYSGKHEMLDEFWAVLEMEDAGGDLERLVQSGQFREVSPIWDVFWQVVFALARGEKVAEFEHRDLHLGNICVTGSRDADLSSQGSLTDIDAYKKLGFTGLKATLIDYTLSRATIPANSTMAVASSDLSLQDYLFDNDSAVAYQYDIYRYMRNAVCHSNPAKPCSELDDPACVRTTEQGGTWAQFHPLTNLVWLHYVLHMLLSQIAWPSEQPSLERESEAQKAREYWKWENFVELERILLEVQDLLDPAVLGSETHGLYSAHDLATYAVQQSWIYDADGLCQLDPCEEPSSSRTDINELAEGLDSLAL